MSHHETTDSLALARLRMAQPQIWFNPRQRDDAVDDPGLPLPKEKVAEAEAGWLAIAPLLAAVIPELAATGGIPDSPLADISAHAAGFGLDAGRLLVKCDHALPVAGSVKARGGFFEVARHAAMLAAHHGLPTEGDALASPQARALFAGHTIAVGSTGNLGMSVGLVSRALGFRAVVHMSADAKAWKVARLREAGVTVVTHAGDYTAAVAAARAESAADPFSHFVDDEQSTELFLGCTAAGAMIERQLGEAGVKVDADNPLVVWLPCGIGGAPGGIGFGLKARFGNAVRVFFVEPVQSPCVLAMLASRAGQPVSVRDFGLTNVTAADGMACAVASDLSRRQMHAVLDGILTVSDDDLFKDLWRAQALAGLRMEPSAAAGFSGPRMLAGTPEGRAWLTERGIAADAMVHLVWSTGGALMPAIDYDAANQRGARLAGAA